MMNVKRKRGPHYRRGSVLVLLAFLLPVLALLAAFTINSAYMQMTRTELMVATDAASRAGGRGLSEYQDVDSALAAARATAALNTVAGSPLRINTAEGEDVEFGLASPADANSDRFSFTPVSRSQAVTGDAANAVRVFGRRENGSLSGPINMIFQGFVDRKVFQPKQSSVAMQVDRDIVLVLDRSGSMSWKDYDWPDGANPNSNSVKYAAYQAGLMTYDSYRRRYSYARGVSSDDYNDWAWEEHFDLGPAPVRPWDDLVLAVEAFLQVLEETPQIERVGLASYSSSGSIDLRLTDNYADVMAELATLGPNGNTAIGYGMQKGKTVILDEINGRRYAAKTMVVMTDGMHNTGTDPRTVAEDIVNSAKVTIHSVTFTSGADQVRMQSVADTGGGQLYHAEDGASLIETFREVANNLPTILTE